MISSILQKIASDYPAAKIEAFSRNELANYIRAEAPIEFRQVVDRNDIDVQGSPGQGNWAEVPWIAFFNREITLSARHGYYLVYLFDADMRRVSLCLAQGVTAVREEFKRHSTREMLRRSALIRDRLHQFSSKFVHGPTEFGGTTQLAKDYNSSVAFYKPYDPQKLPSDSVLQHDLEMMFQTYDALFENAGTDNIETALDAIADDDIRSEFQTIEEKKRYIRHNRIERHSGASKIAKVVHGYTCKGCDFDFEKTYGEIGKGFIEAHHLTPLASLPEGKPVPMDPATDFAVLCSNCHRMVHRRLEPLSVPELRHLLERERNHR